MKNFVVSAITDDKKVAEFLKRILESAKNFEAVKRAGAYIEIHEIDEVEITSECT
jgi:hypothetical protein